MYVVVLPPDDFDKKYDFFTGNTYGPFKNLEEAEKWTKKNQLRGIAQINLVEDIQEHQSKD